MDFHSLMGRASTMFTGKRNDDGISDRLNYRYTVVILVVLAFINMNRLYTDEIKCWVKYFRSKKNTIFNHLSLYLLLDTSILYSQL